MLLTAAGLQFAAALPAQAETLYSHHSPEAVVNCLAQQFHQAGIKATAAFSPNAIIADIELSETGTNIHINFRVSSRMSITEITPYFPATVKPEQRAAILDNLKACRSPAAPALKPAQPVKPRIDI